MLGAISLGATVIEKHFTDNNKRIGPDHHFAMNPKTWRNMIDASRELEASIGDGKKIIEKNEKITSIIQRRSIRLIVDIKKGQPIKSSYLECLRPRPSDAISPMDISKIINKKLKKDKKKGDYISTKDFKV